MIANPILIAARLAFGVLTWTAILIQGGRQIDAGFPLLNFVSYFTILANAFGGTVLLAGAWLGLARRTTGTKAARLPPAWYDRARAAATLNLAVVGLVFVTLLRDVDLGGLLPWINTVHHYVMPAAIVAEWLLVSPSRAPSTRDVLTFFVFPLAYVTYSLIRGALVGWYPYPFFNPAIVGGYGVVMLYVGGMIATYVAVAWAMRRTAG